MALLGFETLTWNVWLMGWLGLSAGFLLFWGGVVYLLSRLKGALSGPRLITALLGAILWGGLGWLLTTPAGLSRITLELYADGVWSPNIFTATWEDNGLWDAPLTLATGEAVSGTLEIAATEPDRPTSDHEVWLVEASWPDGRKLALDEFQAEPGWEPHQINWGKYRDQPVWVSRSPLREGGGAAILRWQGRIAGPLTLIFAKHNRAGAVMVRWNGQEQAFDLYAPDVEFKSINLRVHGSAVWRTSLPITALGKEISLETQAGPNGARPIIEKINLTGIPGQIVSAAGDQLLEALQVHYGELVPTTTGVQLVGIAPDDLQAVFLSGPLAIDSIWRRAMPWLENGLVGLHLAVVGSLLVGSLTRRLQSNTLTNLNLVVTSLLAALVMGELALWMYLPPANKYYALEPNHHVVFNPYPGVMPGITGESHYVINSEGIRGDEFSAKDDYRILVIGGSTAQCIYLDQAEAWPQLLQTKLNQARPEWPVWVGNIGKSGHTSYEHIAHMQYLLPQYPDLDAVILLVGANDLGLVTRLGEAYGPDYLTTPGMKQVIMSRAFDILPTQNPDLLPYYQHRAAWCLMSKVKQTRQTTTATNIELEDEAGKNYIARRRARKEAIIEDRLPDLSLGLAAYHKNINTIIDLAQAHGIRLILMTQPAMWRSDLRPAEEDLLWFGWRADLIVYYSVEALAAGMAVHNEKLLEICQQRQVECIDLASALPQDTTVFYDDVHFNESGAEQAAGVIANYLLRAER